MLIGAAAVFCCARYSVLSPPVPACVVITAATLLLLVLGSALFMDALTWGCQWRWGQIADIVIAGVLLALAPKRTSPRAGKRAVAIEPFKGLLLGLFLFSVHGMNTR